jgi:MFS transporter, DHA3 family, tetracycline resistance protein
MARKLPAQTVYFLYAGITAFLFELVFTVNEVYRFEAAGFSPWQLVIVGTVLELSCFIFEIPTGILADLKSRKLSVIIGVILIGMGFLIEGLVPVFMVILLCQVIWGIGYTFTSGAFEAWISDEVGGKELTGLFLKGAQVRQVGALIAIVLSTAIGAYIINLPMIVGGILFILLGLFLLIYMPETGFKPSPASAAGSYLQQMASTFAAGIRFMKKSQFLIVMACITFFYGLYSEGLDRLWIAHILQDVTLPDINVKPIVWVGLINGTALIASILAVEYIKRRLEKTGQLQKVWLLVVINAVMVLSIIVFAMAGHYGTAFSSYLLFYILRTTNGPIYSAWLNENIESGVRATVLSTYGQLDAFGQIISGPIIGYIAYKTTMELSLIVSGLLLLPVVALFAFLLKKAKHSV